MLPEHILALVSQTIAAKKLANRQLSNSHFHELASEVHAVTGSLKHGTKTNDCVTGKAPEKQSWIQIPTDQLQGYRNLASLSSTFDLKKNKIFGEETIKNSISRIAPPVHKSNAIVNEDNGASIFQEKQNSRLKVYNAVDKKCKDPLLGTKSKSQSHLPAPRRSTTTLNLKRDHSFPNQKEF